MASTDMLDLDEFLSSEPRLAEKTAYFLTKPHLQGDIEALEQQLALVTDDRGRPTPDRSAAGDEHLAATLAQAIEAKRTELRESARGVRVRQLSSTEWQAFGAAHREALDNPESPKRPVMWAELIAACAIAPTMTLEQVHKLRATVGDPQIDEIRLACWDVCTTSGVAIPEPSAVAARVHRLKERATER